MSCYSLAHLLFVYLTHISKIITMPFNAGYHILYCLNLDGVSMEIFILGEENC